MTNERHREYRREHFAIESKYINDEWDGECVEIKYTFNGNQWYAERFTLDEAKQVRDAIKSAEE